MTADPEPVLVPVRDDTLELHSILDDAGRPKLALRLSSGRPIGKMGPSEAMGVAEALKAWAADQGDGLRPRFRDAR